VICDDDARVLATLLSRQRDTIAERWAEAIRADLPNRTCKLTPSAMADQTGSGLAALIEFYSGGDAAALDDHVEQAVRQRLGKCKDCWEFLEDLLLLKQSALPALLPADGSAPIEARTCVSLLDTAVNRMIARFCELFGRELRERQLHVAISDERNRLARELHDSVTQSIHGVTLFAQAADRLLQAGRTDEAAERVRQIQALGSEALRELRLSLFELHPPVLERFGLARALKGRLESVESRAGVRTSFRVVGDTPPPLAVQEALLRVALELLNNTLKHARASSIDVRLEQSPVQASLEVEDDGEGFDPSAEHREGGLGIRGMEERARRLGATLSIQSTPGQGTRARFTVPLRQGKRALAAVGEEVGRGIGDDPDSPGR
jgi:signal transduction histidine kinase